jgi:hypothetical protein
MPAAIGILSAGAALLTGAGGLVLASIFARGTSSDRRGAIVMGALACAHAAVPIVALVVRGAHPGGSGAAAVASLLLSGLLAWLLPAAISAAAQP